MFRRPWWRLGEPWDRELFVRVSYALDVTLGEWMPRVEVISTASFMVSGDGDVVRLDYDTNCIQRCVAVVTASSKKSQVC